MARILLDSKDLIDVVEHGKPVSFETLEDFLRVGKHELVLSYTNVTELVAPLTKGVEFVEVRRWLIKLESLPVCYIHSAITAQELRSAAAAFNNNEPACGISPYVARFDDVVTTRGRTATEMIVGFRLWEIVYTIWTQNALRSFKSKGHADQLRTRFEHERHLGKIGEKPSAKEIYIQSVARDLELHAITAPVGGVEQFGEFLYENWSWCPADRLGFELYHAVQKNSTDVPKDSDLHDFNHLLALPYVDALTCDRRMFRYLDDVLKSLKLCESMLAHKPRLSLNLSELLKLQLD